MGDLHERSLMILVTQCLSFLVQHFTEYDVCRLEVSCPAFSRCDTRYISSSFPPASYYCTCDPGYEPSVQRPGNFILSHEKCVKQTPGKFALKIIIQKNILKECIQPFSWTNKCVTDFFLYLLVFFGGCYVI